MDERRGSVLIVDEALAVGDAAFQRKCFRKMEEMIDTEKRAVIVVSNPRDADGGRRGTGFGLEIVRRRRLASFGDRAALAIEPAPEAYRVSLTIPVEEAAA